MCNHQNLAVEIVTSFEIISFHKADAVPFSMAVLIPLEILSLRAQTVGCLLQLDLL